MNIHIPNPFKGSGGRRRSDESWDALTAELSEAQRLLKPMKGAICCGCPAGIHGQFWVYSQTVVRCPWCEIGRLRALEATSVVVVPAPPAGPPMVPAAVDTPEFRPLPDAPLVSADNQLLLMPDAPAAPVESEGADVNAETQAVSRADLLAAMGEGDTTQLPAVPEQGPVRRVVAVTADQLQPAQAHVPPKLPPAHLVKQQLVTFEPWLRPREDAPDPLAVDDLKATVSAAAVPASPGWRSERVSLSKTG